MDKKNASKYSDAGLICQVIATILFAMFFVIYLITNIPSMLKIVDYMIVLLMFVMAFNNHLTFKRKYLTPVYIIVGICALVLSFVNI